MITRLKIRLKLQSEDKLNTNMSSLMHGFIMEQVSAEYAQNLHISGLKNFNQYIRKDNEDWIWTINALDDEARYNIIDKIISLDKIYIKNKDMYIDAMGCELIKTSLDEIFEKNYYSKDKPSRFIEMTFITPTAFKSHGKYINYPNIKMLFSNMINKYDNASENTSVYDENTYLCLTESAEICEYNLKSRYFHLEGVKIPSFVGTVKIKINGSDTLISFANMLTEFAQYSGIGIKCAMGMGAAEKHKQQKRGEL